MRLDKFLKISLIYKTRSSAEKAISNGEVFLNNKPAKPALNIKIGDIIKIRTILKTVEYKILDIKEKNVSRKDARELYTIINEEKFEL